MGGLTQPEWSPCIFTWDSWIFRTSSSAAPSSRWWQSRRTSWCPSSGRWCTASGSCSSGSPGRRSASWTWKGEKLCNQTDCVIQGHFVTLQLLHTLNWKHGIMVIWEFRRDELPQILTWKVAAKCSFKKGKGIGTFVETSRVKILGIFSYNDNPFPRYCLTSYFLKERRLELDIW